MWRPYWPVVPLGQADGPNGIWVSFGVEVGPVLPHAAPTSAAATSRATARTGRPATQERRPA